MSHLETNKKFLQEEKPPYIIEGSPVSTVEPISICLSSLSLSLSLFSHTHLVDSILLVLFPDVSGCLT